MPPAFRSRLYAEALAFALLLAGCAGATYDTRDDLTISTHVKIALLDDVKLGADRLDATTSNGVVTLSGTVASPADIDRAVAIASKVRGVKEVKSALKVSQFSYFSSELTARRCGSPVRGPGLTSSPS